MKEPRDYYAEDMDNHPFPHLTNRQLASLHEEYRAGSRSAGLLLWGHGLRLVMKIAKKLRQVERLSDDEYLDAIQEGNLSIGEALSEWNPKMGRYSTFMWTVIRNRIVNHSIKESRRGFTGLHEPADVMPLEFDVASGHSYDTLVLTDFEGVSHGGPNVRRMDVEFVVETALDPEEQAVVLGKYFRDLTQTEIANSLKVSQSTVSRILSVALDKIFFHLR